MVLQTGLDITKKAHQVSTWSKKQMLELAQCQNDPLYFMEKFMYIQHPMKGRLLFDAYDYQKEMIDTLANNRYSILLTARQMGKCFTYKTQILSKKTSSNGLSKYIDGGSLINLNFKDKLVNWLELKLIDLVK